MKNETGIIIRANETFTRTWIIPYLHLAGYSRQVTLFYWQRSADHAKLADSYTCLYMESYTRSMINITESKEFIDAAYEMLCWCIENGYVKVENE